MTPTTSRMPTPIAAAFHEPDSPHRGFHVGVPRRRLTDFTSARRIGAGSPEIVTSFRSYAKSWPLIGFPLRTLISMSEPIGIFKSCLYTLSGELV